MKFRSFCSQVMLAAALVAPLSLSVPSVEAQNLFGAISHSRRTGRQGFSWNYGNRRAAEIEAMNQCENAAQTGDCRVLVWFRNACGSIAEDSEGAVGTGWGANRSLSQSAAISSCQRVGSDCRVTRTICTGR
jgi:serine/threonine-protein kinase